MIYKAYTPEVPSNP